MNAGSYASSGAARTSRSSTVMMVVYASGRVAEGLRALEEVADRSRRAKFLAGEAMASLAFLATALHVGDVDRASAQLELIIGLDPAQGEISGDERAASIGLAHLQRGEVGAVLLGERGQAVPRHLARCMREGLTKVRRLDAQGSSYIRLEAGQRYHALRCL